MSPESNTGSAVEWTAFDVRAASRVAVGIALSVAAIGFTTGLVNVEQSAREAGGRTGSPLQEPLPGSLPQAPRYAEIPGAADWSPNAGRESHLGQLGGLEPDLLSPRRPAELSAKRAALAERSARRAYAGAPPVVPHRVNARSASSCLVCHETGRRVGDRVASPIPHRRYASCLQCHAPPAPAALAGTPAGVAPSRFVGQPEPTAGTRAGPGAPPLIPHSTRMRSQCSACHGPRAAQPALATTHPWRSSCRQCHAAGSGYAR